MLLWYHLIVRVYMIVMIIMIAIVIVVVDNRWWRVYKPIVMLTNFHRTVLTWLLFLSLCVWVMMVVVNMWLLPMIFLCVLVLMLMLKLMLKLMQINIMIILLLLLLFIILTTIIFRLLIFRHSSILTHNPIIVQSLLLFITLINRLLRPTTSQLIYQTIPLLKLTVNIK